MSLRVLVGILAEFEDLFVDKVGEMKETCECFHCQGDRAKTEKCSTFRNDENCLAFKALMEVMFYFSHGIADAFGASDASGSNGAMTKDLGAIDILKDAIHWNLFNGNVHEGTISWHSLFNTSAHVFLGSPPLSDITDAWQPDVGAEVHTNFASRIRPTVIAIQYGALAVVAPWLDITKELSCKGCFRFEIIQGRIAVCSGEIDGRYTLHGVTGEICVIETQQTEFVTHFNEKFPPQMHQPSTSLECFSTCRCYGLP